MTVDHDTARTRPDRIDRLPGRFMVGAMIPVARVIVLHGLVNARPYQPGRLETLAPGRFEGLQLRSEPLPRRETGPRASPDGEVVTAAAALFDDVCATRVLDTRRAAAGTGVAGADEIGRCLEDVELHRRTSL